MKKEINQYGEGHEAHYRGYRLKHNPYKRFSKEWEEWRDGWKDSDKDDPYWRRNRNYINKLRLTSKKTNK